MMDPDERDMFYRIIFYIAFFGGCLGMVWFLAREIIKFLSR